MSTHTTPIRPAQKAAPAVPVLSVTPCPECRPLDPCELARAQDCYVCHGRLFIKSVVGIVGREGACA